jgi:hypothetical protein
LADDCPPTVDIGVGSDTCAQLAQGLAGKLQGSASANEPEGILDLSKARNGYFEKRPKKAEGSAVDVMGLHRFLALR